MTNRPDADLEAIAKKAHDETTEKTPWWTADDLRKLEIYDAEYIAAVSPGVVLDRLARLREARAVAERLAAKVVRVRAIHRPQPYADADLRAVSPSLPKEVCAHCRSAGGGAVPWPCPTIRAIGAES